MASTSYRRCLYIDDAGLECERWFDANDTPERNCENHRGILPSDQPMTDKKAYIDFVNEQQALCSKMSFDELDAHIASLEKAIEDQRTRLLASRAVRTQKLDKLTDEERAERKKYKIEKAVQAARPKAPTMKADPVKAMMAKYPKLSEAQVRALLED